MLLQILEDGILTDSQGRRVDFKNSVIIMTSNVGAKLITRETGSLGFSTDVNGSGMTDEKIKESVMGELKRTFRPEFLNRVDDIIVFHQLKKEDITEIAVRMLENLKKRTANIDIEVEFTKAVAERIADEGFDPVYGARPLRRAIQSKIEDKMSEEMLMGNIVAGNQYKCDYVDGEFVFTQV